MEISVLLHNVRSAHNVGSIFRTCDAAGISRVYLTGYTPMPTDRFGRARKDIAKTALGAERSVPWKYHKNPLAVIAKLRKEGRCIVAVEQTPRSIDYRKFSAKGGSSSGGQSGKPAVFIFGNEVRGVSKSILNACDAVVEIPMYGKKESLNVSVAAGIVLFQAVDSH